MRKEKAMAEYIKREDIIKWIDDSLELCGDRYSVDQKNMMELFRTVINDCLPFADVVERNTFEQVMWERDVALAQLAEIGKGFGEKMDDVVEVVRCKDCKFFEPDTFGDCWCSAKSPGVSKGMFSPSGDSYCSDAERR